MLVIGLTGGIGSGKSAVEALFSELGVPVIDADRIARQVVEPGQPALDEIKAQFGEAVLDAQGALNRRRLRKLVFDDAALRKALESILHPRIRARIAEELSALSAPYAIVAIPLLIETGPYQEVDRVLVVDCPEEEQIRRICQRDKVSAAQAAAIMATQATREERLSAADDIIDNAGALQ